MLLAMDLLPPELVLRHVRTALMEDVGSGDVTTLATVPETAIARAVMVAREELVVCGMSLAETAFKTVAAETQVQLRARDGARVARGEKILEVSGPARALLTGERVA